MIHLKRTHLIDAKPEAVWAVMERFMHIEEFSPLVVSVDALTQGENGVGSKRRNHFDNGTSIVEVVTDWKPGRSYAVELTEMAGTPLVEAHAELSIAPESGRTRATWTFDYRVKYGPLGWLFGQTMMKMAMGKIVDGNLQGLADRVGSVQSGESAASQTGSGH